MKEIKLRIRTKSAGKWRSEPLTLNIPEDFDEMLETYSKDYIYWATLRAFCCMIIQELPGQTFETNEEKLEKMLW